MMDQSAMKDALEKPCPIHGKPMRRSGLLYYCECGESELPSSNGKPVMTAAEALWEFHEAAKLSPTLQAAYNVIVLELRALKVTRSMEAS